MEKVAPAIPVMVLPWPSTALPEKFTRRGTTADEAKSAGCCAFSNEQNIESPIQAVESRKQFNFIGTPKL
jgi:hypothetical protein